MKKRALALCLALCLLLTGCSGLLERSFISVEAHNENPVADGDNALRVENYQELVNAVLYYVSHGEETGAIRLYNYDHDVDADLEAACLEVVQEDPLGAYAVDYIKYEVGHIVSYYEAQVHITYRRTAEQIAGVVSVTGSSAIRAELAEAMSQLAEEQVLRIGSFDESAVNLDELIREAYYAAPLASFGMPEVHYALYPAETPGRQRIVEVSLTYPDTPEALREKQNALNERVRSMQAMLQGLSDEALARTAFAMVRDNAQALPDGTGSGAYDALVNNVADRNVPCSRIPQAVSPIFTMSLTGATERVS